MSSLIFTLLVVGIVVVLSALVFRWLSPISWSSLSVGELGDYQVHYIPGDPEQSYLVSVRLHKETNLDSPNRLIGQFKQCGFCLASKADWDMLGSAAYEVADPGQVLVVADHLGSYRLISVPNGYPVAERKPAIDDIWLFVKCQY